jgi:hypothetical protein
MVDNAAELFRVMADPIRLRILYLLRAGELCVGDLVTVLNVPQPTQCTAGGPDASRRSGASLKSTVRQVGFSAVAKPGDVPWAARNVDIVLECSGKFRTTETLDAYFASGVKKVIVAAPVKSGALNIVMGVNDHCTSTFDDGGGWHRRQGVGLVRQ